MAKALLKITSIALLLLLSINTFAGGPWAQEPKKGFLEMSTSTGFSAWVTDVNVQGYIEYGLIKNLSMKAIIPFTIVGTTRDKNRQYIPEPYQKGRLFGPGNVVLGVKYQFLNKAVAMSAGADVWAPTVANDVDKGLRTGYEHWIFKPTLSIGRGFNHGYVYTELYADLNTNHYSHNLGAILEGGYKNDRFYISGYSQYVQSLKNGNHVDAPAYFYTGFFVNNEQYLNVGAKAGINIKKGWGVDFGLFRIFNLVDGSGILTGKAGIFYQW